MGSVGYIIKDNNIENAYNKLMNIKKEREGPKSIEKI